MGKGFESLAFPRQLPYLSGGRDVQWWRSRFDTVTKGMLGMDDNRLITAPQFGVCVNKTTACFLGVEDVVWTYPQHSGRAHGGTVDTLGNKGHREIPARYEGSNPSAHTGPIREEPVRGIGVKDFPLQRGDLEGGTGRHVTSNHTWPCSSYGRAVD